MWSDKDKNKSTHSVWPVRLCEQMFLRNSAENYIKCMFSAVSIPSYYYMDRRSPREVGGGSQKKNDHVPISVTTVKWIEYFRTSIAMGKLHVDSTCGHSTFFFFCKDTVLSSSCNYNKIPQTE